MPSLTWTPQRSFRGISVRSNWGRWKQLAGSPGPGKILTLDPRGSLSLLRTGYRQPARYFGYTRCINRRNDRVSSCHDRCAANGEMDSGRYRRRRYRRPHTGVDWNAQGSLDRFDGRFREPHHRDCGARRRTPHILSGTGGTGRRYRTGHVVLVSGDTSASPVIWRNEIVGQPDVGDAGACLALAVLPRYPAILVQGSTLLAENKSRVVALAAQYRLPAFYNLWLFVEMTVWHATARLDERASS